MKISELFKTLEFHDSPVISIQYLADKKQLILEIELCNYDQEGYQEGEPELLPGQLIFSGLEDFKADPSLDTLDWIEGVNGDISTSGCVSKRDRDGLEAAEFVIIDYNPRALILTFLASDVEWQPI